MREMELYRLWSDRELEDKDLSEELKRISGNTEQINDRFYKELEFGTGGLRGVIGAGTNRMNIYTVRKATQGFVNYLKIKEKSPSMAISFDSRIKSDLFAKEAAKVCAANGVKAYLYRELAPTPVLSFTVRSFQCSGGIMVTASHNPSKYNGYKAYGPDGCQMNLEDSEAVIGHINKLDIFKDVRTMDFDRAMGSGLIEYVPDSVKDAFDEAVKKQQLHAGVCKGSGMKVVYTPLNGTGNRYVRRVLQEIGVEDVAVVPEQENPDGNFTTCPYPNPEFKEALQLGLALAKQQQADLLLATDPDCDRVGVAVPYAGEYQLITGNEMGCLLLNYVASARIAEGTMPKKPVAVKTIVTSELTQRIADGYGIELRNVLTGFKFIGEQIGLLEKKGELDRYVFGFEESYGYLAGTHARDKDAVVASMLICEMTAYYKKQGKPLYGVLQGLYDQYGYYLHKQGNFTCEGEKGMQEMLSIMDGLRKNRPTSFAGLSVVRFADYGVSEEIDFRRNPPVKKAITLPKSNVLCFYLENDASVMIRPSGTEPKMKAYYTGVGRSREHAEGICAKLAGDTAEKLGFAK